MNFVLDDVRPHMLKLLLLMPALNAIQEQCERTSEIVEMLLREVPPETREALITEWKAREAQKVAQEAKRPTLRMVRNMEAST